MAVAFAESLKLWMKTFQNFAPIREVILPGQPTKFPTKAGCDVRIWQKGNIWISQYELIIPYNCHFFYTDTIFGE